MRVAECESCVFMLSITIQNMEWDKIQAYLILQVFSCIEKVNNLINLESR